MRSLLAFAVAATLVSACSSDTDPGATGGAQASSGETPCAVPDECPGNDEVCQKRTCTAGKCGTDFTPQGVPIPTDSVGDCKRRVCDGAGSTMELPDDTDVKTDGKEC